MWWITALHVCLLLGYSILAPTYRAPDEPEHVDLAHLFATTGDYPRWDGRDLSPGIERTKDLVRFDAGSTNLTADEALPKDERPAIDQLEQPPMPTRVNQQPQHPPLYYVMAGGVERLAEVVTGDPSYDLEVWIYRLVSILFVAPLPLIVWGTARLVGLPQALGIAATLFSLAIPQLAHIGSVVNNDSLLLLVFWLSTPVVIRLARGDLRPRVALLAGVLSGVALFTKGFALVLPLWVVAGLLVALRRGGRARLRPVVVAGALYGTVALALGGWWWLRNIVVFGDVMPTRYYQIDIIRATPRSSDDLGHFLHVWSYLSTRLFWGNFGWVDVSIPTLAWGLATAVSVGALVLACARADRVAGTVIGDRLLLLAPLVLLMAIQLVLCLRAYLQHGLLAGMQGRYWYGGLVGVGILIALGLGNLVQGRRGGQRWLPLGMLAAVAVMQGIGISTMLGHYWGAPDAGPVDRVRAVVAWAPLPGELIAIGAVVAVVAAAGAAIAIVRPSGAPAEPLPAEPPEDRSDGSAGPDGSGAVAAAGLSRTG